MTDLKGLAIFICLSVKCKKAHSWDKKTASIIGIMLLAGPVWRGSTVYAAKL